MTAAPDAIVLFDEYGRIADWSPAAERILGYRRDQVVGRDLLDLVFPARLRTAMRGVLQSHGEGWGDAAERSIGVELKTSSGDEVPLEMSLSWAAGSGMFAAHLRDARERGSRERELAADARRRARLLELGQLALAERGLDGLLQRSLEVAIEEVGLSSCQVWELDDTNEELKLLSTRGEIGGSQGVRIRPAPGSQIAIALKEAKTAVVTGDRQLPSPWATTADAGEEMPAGIAAVLVGVDGVLGVLSGAAEPGVSFSATETDFVGSIGLILASAVERDRFNASLASAESRIRTMVERLPAITYRAGFGPTGNWHYISPQVQEILGFSVNECLADEYWWEKAVHKDDLPRVLQVEERAIRDGAPLDIEYRMRARDGREIWVRDRTSVGQPGPDGSEMIAEGILTDITAQKQAEVRLRRLADHDHLTDLLNRRGFEAAVDAWLGDAGDRPQGGMAIIDLDHLKMVNDSLGHAAGDALLREVGAAIRVSLRDGDILGRLGGDEFGLFIPGIGPSAAKRRFGELIELIRHSAAGGPAVTASAGVIGLEGAESLNAADLLVQADLALYQAKERGRDRVVFSDEHHNERLRLVAEIRQAIEEGRLALYAQPILDMESGDQYSSELLVRMIGRDGEPVPANQFIPTAERFGMIRQVDHWVVSHAIEAAATGMRISVNISAASISDASLTDLAAEKLEETGADPSLITFEITETVATPSIEILQAFADRVDALGCGLSLDDVGTGFGTLTYLQNLRFSQLKIDMAFVQKILDSPTDAGIVRSLVVIARELGLTTVAEGVERADVLAELKTMGVDRAQGYYIGKPAQINPAPRPA